jgi:ribosome assembly protein RRB1
MVKRNATEVEAESSSDARGQAYSKVGKAGTTSTKRASNAGLEDEMGEFEDDWEDDIESDEDVVDRAAEELDGLTLLAC